MSEKLKAGALYTNGKSVVLLTGHWSRGIQKMVGCKPLMPRVGLYRDMPAEQFASQYPYRVTGVVVEEPDQ
jgi:hypothetical protein